MSKAASLPYVVTPQVPNARLADALGAVAAQFGATLGQTKSDVNLDVPADRLRDLVRTLKERSAFQFDYLRNMAGVDFGEEGMAIKYQLYSFRHGHTLQITVPLPPHNHPHASVPSIVEFYGAADWHEREAAEMFGIHFEGHPNLKNLLLEEDLHIHPLLKAHPLQKAEIKQGIEDGPAGFNF